MTRTVTIDSVDYTSTIRLDSFSFTECANRGEVGMGGLDVHDTASALTVPALKPVTFTDTAAIGSNTTFVGFTHQRTTQRGVQKVAGVREWAVELTDLNVLADDYVLNEDDDPVRPVETDYARMTWLLTTRFGTDGNITAGVLPNTHTVTLDKADYTTRKASEVAAECSEAAGKMWFIYDYGSGHKLYYDQATGTSLTSTAKISDVAADVDSSTVWAPFNAPNVVRSPDPIFSSVTLKYKNGSVTVTDAGTEAAYRPREGEHPRRLGQESITRNDQGAGVPRLSGERNPVDREPCHRRAQHARQ
jgi:hypothetical protein